MQNKPLKKKAFFVFKLTMAVVLIALLIRNVDWYTIWSEVSTASIPFLVLALAFYVGGLFMCIERWHRAAQFKRFQMTFRTASRFYFAGLFLNNFLPSFLGGDAYQAYVLGRSEKRYPAAASTVMFSRFIGLWATIILFFVFGFLGFNRVFSQPLYAWFGVVLLIFIIGDIAVTFMYAHPRFQGLFSKFPEKVRNFMTEIGGYANWPFLRENFILSAVFACIGVGMFNLALFWAIGEKVPVLPYLATVFLISLISSVPISINNIGLKEWAYFTFFPLIGVRPEAALAVALLGRFIQIAVSVLGAPFFFHGRKTYDFGIEETVIS
ncbi:MAG: flippase-like domain-containing protein [Candidatus Moranbacteria bacterium]|nr:flippase-like domain-containing protein [Candidatus Moranbacteria bacterium]